MEVLIRDPRGFLYMEVLIREVSSRTDFSFLSDVQN